MDFKEVNPANNSVVFTKWILHPLGYHVAALHWSQEKNVYLQEKILNSTIKRLSDKCKMKYKG